MFVFIGALTTGDPSGSSASGVSVLDLDPSSGALTHLQTLEGLQNPSFLAVHPEHAVVYTGERYTTVFGPGEALNGAITSLRVGGDGRLSVLDRQPTGGPAYVNIHPTGRYVFAAIPRSYCVMAYPVAADGRVEPATGIVQHQGRGVNPSTWQAPYPHSVFPDRSGQRVLACDMGLDRIMLHDLDLETGRLQPAAPHPYAQLSSGAGPRHLAVHPDGDFVYTVNELSSTMSAFAYDAESGVMRIQATLSTMPEDFEEHNSGAQILVHPSGRFVYTSNRGHNSIARFSLAAGKGKPKLMGWTSSQGQTPRNFNIDPTGQFMLVANQRSGNVVSFRIDEATGDLWPTGEQIATPSPVCIVFYDR
jgi:6-phosphogluconolactonase